MRLESVIFSAPNRTQPTIVTSKKCLRSLLSNLPDGLQFYMPRIGYFSKLTAINFENVGPATQKTRRIEATTFLFLEINEGLHASSNDFVRSA